MKGMVCPYEDAVRAAMQGGRAEGALASHTDACPACGEVAQVAAFFQALIRGDGDDRPLPDPDTILQRARVADVLLAREAVVAQASRPLLCVEWIALAALALGVPLWVMAGGWPSSLPSASAVATSLVAALWGAAVLLAFSALRMEDI